AEQGLALRLLRRRARASGGEWNGAGRGDYLAPGQTGLLGHCGLPFGSATMHEISPLSPVRLCPFRDPPHHPAGERRPPAGLHARGGECVAGPLVAGVADRVTTGCFVEGVVISVAGM